MMEGRKDRRYENRKIKGESYGKSRRIQHGVLHLTWKVTNSKAKTDTWTRVVIAENEDFGRIILDTGKMMQTALPYYDAEIKRKPAARCYWKVMIQAGDEYAESDTAYFETAKEQEEWSAEFIGAVDEGAAM